MLKCEIIKFEAQDIVTASQAAPCGCYDNSTKGYVCTPEAGSNKHVVTEAFFCDNPNHTCGRS